MGGAVTGSETAPENRLTTPARRRRVRLPKGRQPIKAPQSGFFRLESCSDVSKPSGLRAQAERALRGTGHHGEERHHGQASYGGAKRFPLEHQDEALAARKHPAASALGSRAWAIRFAEPHDARHPHDRQNRALRVREAPPRQALVFRRLPPAVRETLEKRSRNARMSALKKPPSAGPLQGSALVPFLGRLRGLV